MNVPVVIARLVHPRLRLGSKLNAAAAVLAMGVAAFLFAAGAGHGGQAVAEARHRLAVLPFEIEDNSGETGGPGRHDALLAGVTRAVAAEIARSGLYRVAPEAEVKDAIAAVDPGTFLRACNGCELDIGKRAGADRVMIGWLFKMSTLILTLQVVIKDVATGDVVYAKAFDFRGDNEKAWQRAADYMVAALARAESTN